MEDPGEGTVRAREDRTAVRAAVETRPESESTQGRMESRGRGKPNRIL